MVPMPTQRWMGTTEKRWQEYYECLTEENFGGANLRYE
jgi:hypothetical protein